MYQKILGPLDGSKLSECSLEHIKAIATGCNTSEVILLYVIEEPRVSFGEYASQQMVEEMAKQRDKERQETRKRAEDYLARVSADLKKAGLAVKTVITQPELARGVADAILDYADKNKVDLIIMSTHGRAGVSRWAFGSVADRVIRHAKVPVMAVAATGCRAK
jgi:nucleotide-binding universal stress UspA family protein